MNSDLVTVAVLTLNEERHLDECLRSARQLTDNVLVVDSGSSDRTTDIAATNGAIVVHEEFAGFASQRNKALELVQTTWVLFLDADERLTSGLCNEIEERLLSAGETCAGFWIPRQNIVVGRSVRGGGWWPDHQARLICVRKGRYDPAREVHETVLFDGPVDYLSESMVHINYETWSEILTRQRLYTRRLVNAGMVPPPRLVSYLSRPVREFTRRFFRLRGYRDGMTGLGLAAIMALEEFRGCLLARRMPRS